MEAKWLPNPLKLSAAFSYCQGQTSAHSAEICYKPPEICSTFSFWKYDSHKSSENDSEFRTLSERAWIPGLFLPIASTEQDRDLLRISAESASRTTNQRNYSHFFLLPVARRF